ncbi:MAG: hypothetical protein FJ026_17365 [Chloroflexi bacterium]|nr:hypothetical protein [Chloroflexota bacterium]
MGKSLWRVIAGILIIVVGIVLLLQQLEIISLSGPIWGMLALFAGAAIFLMLWLANTAEWWPLIPGAILFSWGLSALLGLGGVAGWFAGLVGFFGSALPFLYIFLRNRDENWWALIPGGVFLVMGLATALCQLLGGDWVGTLVLLGISLAFLAVFLANRRNWWALIPAGVMLLVAIGQSPLGASIGQLWPLIPIGFGLLLVVRTLLRRS